MLTRFFPATLFALVVSSPSVHAQSTSRQSTDSAGAQSNNWSSLATISQSGRLLVFTSSATNLVPFDTNALDDVFAKDLTTGAVTRLNVGGGGAQAFGGGSGADGYWAPPSISEDDGTVVFVSAASNLVLNDSNGETDVFARNRQANTTTRISVSAAGAQANGMSHQPAISGNGRYVTFRSSAANLVPGDTNGVDDIFVKDLVTGAIERASVSSAETQANDESWRSSISADGRYVAFESEASNLVAGDTLGNFDVFVRDRLAGTTSCVSLTSGGAQAHGMLHSNGGLSADGRYVVFESFSALVPFDTNAKADIYLRDLASGTISLVSLTEFGALADSHCYRPRISADGSHVTFESNATNLVGGDGNASFDIFERDVVNGTTVAVSVGVAGAFGNQGSLQSSVSADGRWVAFDSDASNLVPGDTNASRDIFVREVWTPPPPPCLVRESLNSADAEADGPSGGAYVSADGHWVGFASAAGNLVFGDTNGATDVFLRDREGHFTSRCSVDSAGVEGDGPSEAPSVSSDGRWVAFASLATNLVPGDVNFVADVFVHDRSTGATARISVDSAGLEADGSSYPPPWGGPSISPDGRYVAFCSLATNLVLGDTNGAWDVFIHDRDFDGDGLFDEHVPGGIRTWRASVTSAGVEGDGDSGRYGLWLSAYGRVVAFQSFAGNLVPVDMNLSDIFTHNNINGNTAMVNLDPADVQAPGFHFLPSISADLSLASDGRYVTWTSDSPTLVVGDGNGVEDIFLRDRSLGVTSRVNVATSGAETDAFSTRSMVDASGRYVVFDTVASNLDPDDGNFASDVYLRDRQDSTTQLLSRPSGMGGSVWPTVAANATVEAFSSDSAGLVESDTNGLADVFVRDCSASPMIAFCEPGVAGVMTCPCNNPPTSPGRGCNNFGAGPADSAELSATGTPSIAADTVLLLATGENNTSFTVFLQGPSTSMTGLAFGAGVRCMTGSLKRLYTGSASGGMITRPQGGDPNIHTRSATVGDPLSPGIVRYYMSFYRDPSASGPCSNAAATFNCTNAGKLTWLP